MHNYHVSMYTELSSLLLAFYVPQDQFAATPLMSACIDSKLEVAKYLIEKGANINSQNKVVSTFYCFHNCLFINNVYLLELRQFITSYSLQKWLHQDCQAVD